MGLQTELRTTYHTEGVVSTASRGLNRGLQILVSPVSRAAIRLFKPFIADRKELKALCRRSGTVLDYGSEQRVKLLEPDASNGPDEKIAGKPGDYTITKPFVGTIPHAKLLGPHPLVYTHGRIPIDPLASPQIFLANIHQTVQDLTVSSIVSRPNGIKIDEAVLLYNAWSKGYFHWVTESLARLEGVEQYREETGSQPMLILGPNPTDFQLETLELLGYSSDDWIAWDADYGTVERLVMPSMRRETDNRSYSLVATEWLRKRMRPAALDRVDPSRFSQRVYISRDDAGSRRIVNEEEVMDLLREYGFEAYRLAEMSVAETITLFSQAEIVVGPHGAGLTDILYADDAAVIELFREESNTRVYYQLAKQLGHWYGYLHCQSQGKDIKVDCKELKHIVEEVIN